MRAVPAFILAALCAIVAAQEVTTDVSDSSNSIETKPSVRLDPYIRKALLKALSDLEENDNFTPETEDTETPSTVDSELLQTGEQITENSPTQTPGIQIHSFVVNGQSAFANSTNVTPTFIDNTFSILSTTTGNVENQVTATLPTQSPQNEIIQTRESGINVQQVRSIPVSALLENVINSTAKPAISTTTTSTTTTTTTTTPKPTHNDDGENIEDVNRKDVQVFQAPLVAAFTVHQDARGLPKKVVPIYQQQNIANVATPLSVLPTVDLPPLALRQQNFNENNIIQPDFMTQQLALQRQLEEKQRVLEEQLRLLQLQQRQQEEALRKQQFFFQQKQQQQDVQRQQILFEQQRIQSIPSGNSFQFQGLPKNNSPNQFINPNNGPRPQSSQVSIQASVPLDHANGLTIQQQQLPNREAVDFLIHLRNQQPEQFPLQENHLPHGITNFLQPFNQGTNFNQIRTDDPFRQKQGNRVFRQESGVGNFGFNNFQNQNHNRFNLFSSGVNNNNRLFPVSRQHQFSPDIELKQLLVQTGLNSRNPEDLNIVSKVLSLNHGVPFNNNNNRLTFDRRQQLRASL